MSQSVIEIITGSIGGTATQVGEAAATHLRALGREVKVNHHVRPADLSGDAVLLLCHSNTGAGELPDNILPLYLHLTRDYPRIAGRRYGVINLGDSSYTSFNEAGVMLDAAMCDLGAVRIGEPLVFDASEGAPDEAVLSDWLAGFHAQI